MRLLRKALGFVVIDNSNKCCQDERSVPSLPTLLLRIIQINTGPLFQETGKRQSVQEYI